MQDVKIAYMSSSKFGLLILQILHDLKLPISLVYTKPAAPRDRHQKSLTNPVTDLARKLSLPVVEVHDMQHEDNKDIWRQHNINLAIVAGFGYMIPDFYLDLRHGCWNIHASLLPRWRGAAPIERSILAGDTETGISIMRVVSELDAGFVIAQQSMAIQDLNSEIIHDRLAVVGANLMVKMFTEIIHRTYTEQTQDVSLVTYAHKIAKAEFRLDWHDSSEELYRKILAFPGKAWCLYQGKRLIIHNARPTNFDPGTQTPPGSVVATPLVVCCADNSSLEIQDVQLAGQRKISAAEFCRGYHISTQEILT